MFILFTLAIYWHSREITVSAYKQLCAYLDNYGERVIFHDNYSQCRWVIHEVRRYIIMRTKRIELSLFTRYKILEVFALPVYEIINYSIVMYLKAMLFRQAVKKHC